MVVGGAWQEETVPCDAVVLAAGGFQANTIDTPPYQAFAVTCGITYTFGGLRIDQQARVLDTDLSPIPGLYAAGELTGGLFYFNYPGGSGLTNGSVFGKIAGAGAASSS
jgi:tricarballylate dehydrogenase